MPSKSRKCKQDESKSTLSIFYRKQTPEKAASRKCAIMVALTRFGSHAIVLRRDPQQHTKANENLDPQENMNRSKFDPSSQ
jgi:hypothetical protein